MLTNANTNANTMLPLAPTRRQPVPVPPRPTSVAPHSRAIALRSLPVGPPDLEASYRHTMHVVLSSASEIWTFA